MQITPEQRAANNKKANYLAWFVQDTIYGLQTDQFNRPTSVRLAASAIKALQMLQPLTGDDYRSVSDDLNRIAQGHTARGIYWNATINQMEHILQATQNAPMAVRKAVAV